MKQLPFSLEIYALPGMYQLDPNENYWNDFFDECRNVNIRFITVFPFVFEDKGLYNKFSPFKKTGGVYDLTKWDEGWWESITRLLHLANKKNIILTPVGFCKYNERPFQVNKQGVNFWGYECLKYQSKYLGRLMRVWDNKYRTVLRFPKAKWFRLSNETQHPSHYTGAKIANFHQRWYDVVGQWVPLRRTICDISHSEFAKLDGPHTYCEYFKDCKWESVMLAGYLDKTQLAFRCGVTTDRIRNIAYWGDERYQRKYWIEWHDINPTTLALPHEEGATETLHEKSVSINYGNIIFSTDGNSEGDGEHVGNTPYKIMTSDDLYDLCVIARDHPKNVRVHYLPMEMFDVVDGVLIENLDNLDWGKLSIPKLVWG